MPPTRAYRTRSPPRSPSATGCSSDGSSGTTPKRSHRGTPSMWTGTSLSQRCGGTGRPMASSTRPVTGRSSRTPRRRGLDTPSSPTYLSPRTASSSAGSWTAPSCAQETSSPSPRTRFWRRSGGTAWSSRFPTWSMARPSSMTPPMRAYRTSSSISFPRTRTGYSSDGSSEVRRSCQVMRSTCPRPSSSPHSGGRGPSTPCRTSRTGTWSSRMWRTRGCRT